LAIEATEQKMKAEIDQDSTAKRERERERESGKRTRRWEKCRLMRDNTSKNEKNEGTMEGDLVLCFLYLLLLAS
jgi:hypothetical protein